MSEIRSISGREFEHEVLQSELPVLVDFCADWCAPCHAMSGILDRVAAELGDTAKVVKVDTDAEPELASDFHISSIPAFYVLYRGQVVDGSIGLTPAEQLRDMVERAVADNVEANE